MQAVRTTGLPAFRASARRMAGLAAALLAPAAVAHAAPLDYFLHAAGPAATPTMRLGWGLAALVVAVALIVSVLLVGGIVRRRPPAQPDAVQGEGGGMRFVWIGTTLSSIALFIALFYVLVTLDSVASPGTQPRLTIAVTAYDWWWKIEYDNPGDPVHRVVTANEIHIPTNEPVKVELRSADVIHAFWVPRLAGKTQTIPGIVNQQWIQADHAGTYRGQCSQFCGAQHAHMAFEVVAQTRGDFDAWYAAQAKPQPRTAAAAPAASDAATASDAGTASDIAAASASASAAGSSPTATTIALGKKLFGERCAGCHAIRGTDAVGAQAPDLTHLDSRRLIAAGTLVNTAANQLDWIQHAQQIKPDTLMPSIQLSANDAQALSAYLQTLH